MRLARSLSVALLLALTGYLVVGRSAPRPARSRHEADNQVKTESAGGVANATPADHQVATNGNLFDAAPIASFLADQNNGLTAAVFDERNGVTSLYRPEVAEDTASIMKVDILATLLSEAQAQDRALTPEEQELSVEMIEESDDDDAQDLWDAEGGAAAVDRLDAAAGLTDTDPDQAGYWGLSTTTAADQVQLLKAVAYPNSVLTNASRSYELSLMKDVDPDQAWGISAGVSPRATVAIKNGWLPLDAGGWQMNSIGFVKGDGRDYLVAVLSNGNASEAQGIDTIERLSTLIWKELAPASS
jgi:beta-lactamase family protein